MVSPTAATILFGENAKPPFPAVTVWTEPELEAVVVAGAAAVVLVVEPPPPPPPYCARVKGRTERR
jgi:hypothetical protein